MRFPEILTHPENFVFKSGFPDIRKFPAKWKHWSLIIFDTTSGKWHLSVLLTWPVALGSHLAYVDFNNLIYSGNSKQCNKLTKNIYETNKPSLEKYLHVYIHDMLLKLTFLIQALEAMKRRISILYFHRKTTLQFLEISLWNDSLLNQCRDKSLRSFWTAPWT